jgi:hypothetical protein
MKKAHATLASLALLAGALLAAPAAAEDTAPKPRPVVQIAILLDSSNSMDGLIDQAKSQLWKIVTEFAKTSRDGMKPDLEVALYHYGNDGLPKAEDYIRQLVPLSTDLDKVSEELFKIKTNGGEEYCGAVIRRAVNDLKWSDDKKAYKAIFIAGNEPFTQGGVRFEDACKEAATKGIIVNTIFCGNEKEGIDTKWADGARLADGTYMAIDQNRQVAHVDAPQDKEIAELGAKLNSTYIGYGRQAPAAAARQAEQDKNATVAGTASVVSRSSAKASAVYDNSGWDLVDATKKDEKALEKLKPEDLPEEMRKLDAKGRAEYVENKAKERAELQKKIQDLSAARDKYVAEKQKEQTGEKTFDAAVIQTVRDQAKRADLHFEEKK